MAARTIEACVSSVEDAVLAQRLGVDRLELVSALPLGGLTPSAGLIRQVKANVSVPVVVMIRPRPGGFCYTDSDWRTALADAEWSLAQGVAGVAFGVLNDLRDVDLPRVAEMVNLAEGRQTVFHRAFDLVHHWPTALEQLIDAGVTRILTSGLHTTAERGTEIVAQMVSQAAGRIEIVTGGGITAENVEVLMERTGVEQVHGSFSTRAVDPGYGLTSWRFAPNDFYTTLDTAHLRRVIRVVRG